MSTSAKSPVQSADTESMLDEITRKIVEAFQPERVILFGSYAYGIPEWDSDIDLLVIMHTQDRPAERSVRIARVCRPRYVAMDILVRTPEEVVQRLEEFDPFFEEIMTRGRVLYEAAR